MANRTVFYSWQSDLPNATNRNFIQRGLERTAASIARDDTVDIEPVIDRDTAGVAGSPDIAATIFSKIDVADAVVFDLTIISPAGATRPCPNPNVLVELGYAIRSRGWDKIVLVMNTAFGGPNDLPFDLRTRRVMTYGVPDGAEDGVRTEQRRRLESQLDDALRAILLQHHAPTTGEVIAPPSLEAQTIAAVRSAAPGRRSLARRFMEGVIGDIVANDPHLGSEADTYAQLEGALANTAGAVAAFGNVAVAAVEMRDAEILHELYRRLEPIVAQYQQAHGAGGLIYHHQFDYWRFLGHEMFLMLVAILVRAEEWALLTSLLSSDIFVPNASDHGAGTVTFAYHRRFGLHLVSEEARRTGHWFLRAEMLRARHSGDSPAAVVPFPDLIDADLLCFMRSELPPDEANRHAEWFPDVALLGNRAPEFLYRAARTEYARQLAGAVGLPSAEVLRDRLLERRGLTRNDLPIQMLDRSQNLLGQAPIQQIASRP